MHVLSPRRVLPVLNHASYFSPAERVEAVRETTMVLVERPDALLRKERGGNAQCRRRRKPMQSIPSLLLSSHLFSSLSTPSPPPPLPPRSASTTPARPRSSTASTWERPSRPRPRSGATSSASSHRRQAHRRKSTTNGTSSGLEFEVWDLGGQANLRPSWAAYYKSSDAAILVVDCTDRARVGIARGELVSLLADDHLADAPLLVFANKQDARDAMRPPELTAALALHGVQRHDWHVQGCCALSGEGLEDGLRWLAEKVGKKKQGSGAGAVSAASPGKSDTTAGTTTGAPVAAPATPAAAAVAATTEAAKA